MSGTNAYPTAYSLLPVFLLIDSLSTLTNVALMPLYVAFTHLRCSSKNTPCFPISNHVPTYLKNINFYLKF